MNIKTIVAEFSGRLSTVIESEVVERARTAVLSAFGVAPRRGPGRPRKDAVPVAPVAKKARKKLPRQLCPVPGCKNPAAPIFGMVCAKHKDLPKAKIKKFREARRAKKLGLPAPKAHRRRVAKKTTARRATMKGARAVVAVQATPVPSPLPS